jgi:hypothetical protein
MLEGRLHQEGVAFSCEIEMLAEIRSRQEGGVGLHFDEVILPFPDKRDALELTYTIPFNSTDDRLR